MLGIRLGILKFSELEIFILNQTINRLVQHPPAPSKALIRQGFFFMAGQGVTH